MAEVFDEIGKIAEDLVNIEVNIILQGDISAQKMPKPRHAFYDIGKQYYGMLEGYGCLNEDLFEADQEADWQDKDTELLQEDLKNMKDQLNGIENQQERRAQRDLIKRLEGFIRQKELIALEDYVGSCDAFSYMRDLANDKIKIATARIEEMEASGPLSEKQKEDRQELDAEISMLYRIKDKSDQIKGIFNTKCIEYLRGEGELGETIDPKDTTAMCELVPEDSPKKKFLTNLLTRTEIEFYQEEPLPMNPDQLALLRKIWEVGTTEIAMQTVVQLDGDVVTRILRKYADEDYTILHKLHDEGVSTAIGFWKDLVGLVKDFFESISGLLKP